MSTDFFIDSNIALYALDKATFKNKIALELIKKNPIISTQVVLESINICLKKFKFSKEVSYQHGMYLMDTCALKLIDETTLVLAFENFCSVSIFSLGQSDHFLRPSKQL